MPRIHVVVSMDAPREVTPAQLRQFIREAISGRLLSQHPESPLQNLNTHFIDIRFPYQLSPREKAEILG